MQTYLKISAFIFGFIGGQHAYRIWLLWPIEFESLTIANIISCITAPICIILFLWAIFLGIICGACNRKAIKKDAELSAILTHLRAQDEEQAVLLKLIKTKLGKNKSAED